MVEVAALARVQGPSVLDLVVVPWPSVELGRGLGAFPHPFLGRRDELRCGDGPEASAAIIRSWRRRAGSGVCFPFSHAFTVLKDTRSSRASCSWVRLSRERMVRTKSAAPSPLRLM